MYIYIYIYIHVYVCVCVCVCVDARVEWHKLQDSTESPAEASPSFTRAVTQSLSTSRGQNMCGLFVKLAYILSECRCCAQDMRPSAVGGLW